MFPTLPQETFNEIIAHLRGEGRTLQSLSTVAKRFTDECRRHLFASVYIDSGTKFTRWCNAIPPGEDGLSRYVHVLNLGMWPDDSLRRPMILREHLVHLRSFTQVEHLKIRPLDLHEFSNQDLVEYFGHFSSTVRSISIRPKGNNSSILNFLALFPLLETTILTSALAWGTPDDTVPANPVCRGDLVLEVCKIDTRDDILDSLIRPTTCYRRLGLGLVEVDNPAPLERFLEACAASLESIQLVCCFFGPYINCPHNLLSPLTELRDVTLSLRYHHDYFDVLAILSSITSTKIRSVTLFIWECPFPGNLDTFSLRWVKIENALCRLAELKGTESTGGVVLDVYFDDKEPANEVLRLAERGEFMPRFQERGVVNVCTERMDLQRAMLRIVPEEFR